MAPNGTKDNNTEDNNTLQRFMSDDDFFAEIFSNTALMQVTVGAFIIGTLFGLLSMFGII